MESKQFDAIARRLSMTRSRRGMVGSMAAAGLGLGLMQLGDAEAKRRKRKKRCKKLLDTCTPGGKRKCCGALECGEPTTPDSFQCCKPLGSVCENGDECCEGGCLPPLIGTGPSACRVIQP